MALVDVTRAKRACLYLGGYQVDRQVQLTNIPDPNRPTPFEHKPTDSRRHDVGDDAVRTSWWALSRNLWAKAASANSSPVSASTSTAPTRPSIPRLGVVSRAGTRHTARRPMTNVGSSPASRLPTRLTSQPATAFRAVAASTSTRALMETVISNCRPAIKPGPSSVIWLTAPTVIVAIPGSFGKL